MGQIAEGKHSLRLSIEGEIGELSEMVEEVRTRALESASEAKGLNGLEGTLRGFANILDNEATKLRESLNKCLAELGIRKDPIVENTNFHLAEAVSEAKRREA